ncbi:MAG: phosphonopyruvate decarboxylase [Lachnospiraceae bacterium]|nr:phosphonopyruvate decarboxylase [Lachnospiraceae bacterium]
MKIKDFLGILGTDFYTGVPDSQLKALCDELISLYGAEGEHHVIAANEGNAVGIAAGYHLATGRVPVVYMQNSGEGNIINPLASLLNEKVYGIPCIFIIGWRGEPGVHDEPQHIFQGEVTLKLLEDMDVEYRIIDKNVSLEDMKAFAAELTPLLEAGKQVAYVIRKGALEGDASPEYKNDNRLTREEAIKHIIAAAGDDPVISTTGKASRELFEAREAAGQGHGRDFLTVGSMGHCSSIALGVAVHKPEKRVWCIDGDGAALMHMGAMAVIADIKPANLIHVVINNGAHESVGGQPTVMGERSFKDIALCCGYPRAFSADDAESLDKALAAAKEAGELSLIEVSCAIGSRADLGRPTTSAMENKNDFMKQLAE